MINLTTRSALGRNGFHGDAGVGAARFSTLEGSAAAGWGGKRSGLFLDLDASKSDRFLDPVSFDNLHNQGNTRRLFIRYDLITPSASDSFRFTGSGGRTDRDVPNLPSQEIAGQDQQVVSQDWNLNLGYQHVAAAGWVLDAQIYGRDNKLRLERLGERHAGQRRSGPLARQPGDQRFDLEAGGEQRAQGGSAGQALPDPRILPLRDHRSRPQRSRGRGLQPQPRPVRPDPGRLAVRLQRRADGPVLRGLRAGHRPAGKPDNQRRLALRPQQPFRDGEPSAAAHRARLLHPGDQDRPPRLVRPDVHHAGVREHPALLLGGGGGARAAGPPGEQSARLGAALQRLRAPQRLQLRRAAGFRLGPAARPVVLEAKGGERRRPGPVLQHRHRLPAQLQGRPTSTAGTPGSTAAPGTACAATSRSATSTRSTRIPSSAGSSSTAERSTPSPAAHS